MHIPTTYLYDQLPSPLSQSPTWPPSEWSLRKLQEYVCDQDAVPATAPNSESKTHQVEPFHWAIFQRGFQSKQDCPSVWRCLVGTDVHNEIFRNWRCLHASCSAVGPQNMSEIVLVLLDPRSSQIDRIIPAHLPGLALKTSFTKDSASILGRAPATWTSAPPEHWRCSPDALDILSWNMNFLGISSNFGWPG